MLHCEMIFACDVSHGARTCAAKRGRAIMSKPTLTISSRNYSSWSLRGWLLCTMAGLEFEVEQVPSDDPSARAELLLLSPSFLVPRLNHGRVAVWDTLAIGEYLHELRPKAGLLPADSAARSHCRSVCGEMHSGFANLRSALPMNLKARYRDFGVWTGARADIARIQDIWSECLDRYGGPYLFGAAGMADAMYAPVCTRFDTYGVTLEEPLAAYSQRILAMPAMREWIAGAKQEPDALEELEVEF